MFSAPTKNKTALFGTFSLPRAPKSSQNIGFYDVFATTKNASVAKTPLFATLWQHNMSEMLYFTVFLERLFKNSGIYIVLWKHMHETLQIPTNSKITFSMATSHKQQKHCYLQRFSAMIFPRTRSFLTIFSFWSLPKQRGGTPPPPSTS